MKKEELILILESQLDDKKIELTSKIQELENEYNIQTYINDLLLISRKDIHLLAEYISKLQDPELFIFKALVSNFIRSEDDFNNILLKINPIAFFIDEVRNILLFNNGINYVVKPKNINPKNGLYRIYATDTDGKRQPQQRDTGTGDRIDAANGKVGVLEDGQKSDADDHGEDQPELFPGLRLGLFDGKAADKEQSDGADHQKDVQRHLGQR